MNVNTEHLARCILTLQSSLRFYEGAGDDAIVQEVYRNAVVKSFELCLEISGKLLRRALKEFDYSNKTVDEWFFKDLLRHAAKHGLMEPDALPRWFAYRDNRNNTAHDYGEGFAHETLALVQQFLGDVTALEATLRDKFRAVSETALLLPAEALTAVRALLRRHVPRAEVWAYGSRVDGRAQAGSDLDLVVRNPEDLNRPQEGLDALKAAFRESDLPFLVDVLDWARIPESFRVEIERAHVVMRGGEDG